MKKLLVIILAAVFVFAFAACGNNSGSQTAPPASPPPAQNAPEATPDEPLETVTVTIATTKMPAQDVGIAVDTFVSKLEEKLGDRVDVTVFGGGQLYNATEQTQALIRNEVNMVFDITSLLQQFDNRSQMIILPGIFPDINTAYKVLDEPEVRDFLFTDLAASNIKMLAIVHGGGYVVSNSSRAIQQPSDMAGLKIRASGALELGLVEACGGASMVTPSDETFSALQQKVIDGTLNPAKIFIERSFYEVNKYLTDLSIVYFASYYISSNNAWFDGLPADVQAAIIEAANETQAEARAYAAVVDSDAFSMAAEHDVEVFRPADLSEWYSLAATAAEADIEAIGVELVDEYRALVAKYS